MMKNYNKWEKLKKCHRYVAGGDIERNSRGDHRESARDERGSSIARAHYHVCVGSERDDSVYASCRRE